MALSTGTLTFDLADLLGTDFDARRTKVTISTNIPGDTLVDTAANQIRLGSGKVTLNADGTGSAVIWLPGPDGNPTSWQTYVAVDYADTGTRQRVVRTFGPFTINATADLADLIDEQEIPPTYLSTVTQELQAYVDAAEEITGLTGEDEAIAYLLGDPTSESSQALDAALDVELAERVPAAVVDALADDDTPAEAAAAAVEAALIDVHVPVAEDDDEDEFSVRFDDGDKFFRANETDGITGTLIEGAEPAPVAGFGVADVDGKDGHARLTSVLTSGPDIISKGDSIARAWTPDLAVALATYGYTGRVLNYSVGGENTPTILARTGGSPFLAAVSGGSIPTSGGVTVTLSEAVSGLDADLADSPRINPLAQAPDGFNPCTLVGDNGVRVRGIMTCHDSTGSNPFTFTRLETGTAVPAAYPTPVVTWAAQNTVHGIPIYAVGQNDDGTVLNYTLRFDMIEQAIIRQAAGNKRFLVLTAFSGGPSTRSAEETEARRRWGRYAVLTRPWLSSYAALAAVGLTPTSADDTAIAAGNVADSFFTAPDTVHPNAIGRQALIRLILNRLIELEWI